MKKNKTTILETDYDIYVYDTFERYSKALKNNEGIEEIKGIGYCTPNTNSIYLVKKHADDSTIKPKYFKRMLTHEVSHAYFEESGLDMIEAMIDGEVVICKHELIATFLELYAFKIVNKVNEILKIIYDRRYSNEKNM